MSKSTVSPRNRILDTATRLFYEQGYQATGINQIIKEAAVAKASFYHHFPAKEDLGVAYLQSYQVQRMKRIRGWVAQYDVPRDQVLGLFDYLRHRVQSPEFQGCALINMMPQFPQADSTMRQIVAQNKAETKDFFAELVQNYVGEEASAARVSQLTNAIYLLFDGAIIGTQAHAELWPVEEARRLADQLLG